MVTRLLLDQPPSPSQPKAFSLGALAHLSDTALLVIAQDTDASGWRRAVRARASVLWSAPQGGDFEDEIVIRHLTALAASLSPVFGHHVLAGG